MSSTISISCPKCKKIIKAPASLKGKKIRCKGCGQTLAVEERPGTDEWGVIRAYGVTDEKLQSRCPFCAQALESDDAIVCLQCGYNLQTRERLKPQVLHAVSAGDWIVWLGPGILLALVAVAFIGAIVCVWMHLGMPEWMDWMQEWPAVKIYLSVFCAFVSWGTGYFAFKRLALHPHPPEHEKVQREKEEEE